jgi:hypothetical protein
MDGAGSLRGIERVESAVRILYEFRCCSFVVEIDCSTSVWEVDWKSG